MFRRGLLLEIQMSHKIREFATRIVNSSLSSVQTLYWVIYFKGISPLRTFARGRVRKQLHHKTTFFLAHDVAAIRQKLTIIA